MFSKQLAALGAEVLVSVATPLGAEEQGERSGITVHCGRLTPEEMTALLQGLTSAWTRPIPMRWRQPGTSGQPVKQRARSTAACSGPKAAACREHGVCLCGPRGGISGPDAGKCPACHRGQGAFCLCCAGTGTAFPRVLPTREGIAACEGADIPHKNIIAMQGPFSYALNRALMEQFAIRFLVTKDGGAAGGFEEKARAAQDTGAQLIVIRRPAEQGETAEQILTHCKEMLQ